MDRNLRPETLDEFIGQKHLLSPSSALYQLLEKNALPHSFFYGPPGTGKTTLARIIASELGKDFFELNATSLKIDEMRKIVAKYRGSLIQPLLFIDEVHRLSKNQQEVLLPIMEKEEALIIGASTQNPFFALTAAIRSRAFLFEFKPLGDKELQEILQRGVQKLGIEVEKDAAEYLVQVAAGDARIVVKFLLLAKKSGVKLTYSFVHQLAPRSVSEGASSKEDHYALASALIKSIRGSDVDAALYYLARLIAAAEPPEFIARRLVILASEDIGNANPNALSLATSALVAVKNIGYPEARIILSQCVIYLASSPKSNSAYKAINKALEFVQSGDIEPIPERLRPPRFKGYKNPHDFGGFIEQEYMQKKRKLYESKKIGFEKTLDEWLTKIRGS